MSDGITWVASYPKSGNTMLRMLLEAYHYNSESIDINNMVLISGDAGATLIQSVSPIPTDDLGFNGEALLRPAMLLNYYCSRTPPVYMKTHFANLQTPGLPPFIPREVTRKAVYIVRDPRDVFHSFASYFNFSPKMTATAMSGKDFTIGGIFDHTMPATGEHSSDTTSTTHGTWRVGCSSCHNQHKQEEPGGKFIRSRINLALIGKSGIKKKWFQCKT